MTPTGQAGPTICRGVRGAITVEQNTAESILAATRELLIALVDANGIDPDDIGGVWFTTTTDLNADYPAVAARQLGWTDMALMCAHEMNVPHGLPKCVRVMILWNTARPAREIHHVYLRGAVELRPERSGHMAP